jgi:SAM-dependent methyltransferase
MGFSDFGTIEDIKKREMEKRDIEAVGYIDYVEKVYGPFRSKAYTDTIMHHLKLNDDEVWLDAGSGVGRMSLEIAPKVEQLVCVDHSSASLKILEKKAATMKLTNVQTFHSDVCNYAGETNYFYGILCNEVLQHIPSYEERLKGATNLHRMLRPGGRCLVNVIRWRCAENEEKEGYWGKYKEIYRYYFTQIEIMNLMKDAGFTRIYLYGLDILPRRLSNILPITWSFFEVWCSMIPSSVQWGNNILAIGIK